MKYTEEEKKAYLEYFSKPLTDEEKAVIIKNGWEFLNEEYIFIPDDYDGCMAYGTNGIRRVLMRMQHKDLFYKCNESDNPYLAVFLELFKNSKLES